MIKSSFSCYLKIFIMIKKLIKIFIMIKKLKTISKISIKHILKQMVLKKYLLFTYNSIIMDFKFKNSVPEGTREYPI